MHCKKCGKLIGNFENYWVIHSEMGEITLCDACGEETHGEVN